MLLAVLDCMTLATGLPCLDAYFSPYLYSRIFYVLYHPCFLLLGAFPARININHLCQWGFFGAGFIKSNLVYTSVYQL